MTKYSKNEIVSIYVSYCLLYFFLILFHTFFFNKKPKKKKKLSPLPSAQVGVVGQKGKSSALHEASHNKVVGDLFVFFSFLCVCLTNDYDSWKETSLMCFSYEFLCALSFTWRVQFSLCSREGRRLQNTMLINGQLQEGESEL